MTTLTSAQSAQNSIEALSGKLGANNGYESNDWADSAASKRTSTSRRSRSGQAAVPSQSVRIQLPVPALKIVREVVARVNELLTLRANWDSYGGRPVSIPAAMDAISWLSDSAVPGLPAPSVVPGSDGSIQLEWHIHDIDLEILFSPSARPEFVYENHESGAEEEGYLSTANSGGRALLRQLASRADR